MEDTTKSKLVDDEHMVVAISEPNKANEECKAGEETDSCSAFVLKLLTGTTLLALFMLLLVIGNVLYVDYSGSFVLNPSVVSSFVSKKINGSHVTSSWDISVYLGILDEGIGCSVAYKRVDAYLTRSASLSPTRQDDDLVASTLVFPMRQIGAKDCNLQGIQVRAEDAEVAEDRFDSSRVGVSVRVWARVVKLFFSERYYFVWISCNPDWIRFPDPIHRFSSEEKKCQVRIEQIKSDESRETMHI